MENLFKVESLGISEESCDYDKMKVDAFNSSLSLEDGFYEVELPWHETVAQVKSNYHVSLCILDKVVSKLEKDGLHNKYNSVIEQQVADGILEPINLAEIDTRNHVWKQLKFMFQPLIELLFLVLSITIR